MYGTYARRAAYGDPRGRTFGRSKLPDQATRPTLRISGLLESLADVESIIARDDVFGRQFAILGPVMLQRTHSS
jgi:hypothetical protein